VELTPRQGAVLGVNVGRLIVTNGDFVSCVKVCTAIELLFRLVSGVGPGIGVLDGIHIPQGEGSGLRVILVH